MEFESLDQLKGTELRHRFAEIMGRPPPPKASRYFLLGNIAWTLQCKQSRKDPGALRQGLAQRSTHTNGFKKRPCKPGTRLVREWQGKVYEVSVLSTGYEYDGSVYQSLSQIANQITGTHCSGPRFFGIHKKP